MDIKSLYELFSQDTTELINSSLSNTSEYSMNYISDKWPSGRKQYIVTSDKRNYQS